MKNLILKEFKLNAHFRLSEGLRMIQIAMSKVDNDLLWKRPTASGMSIGNQLIHCSGNMTQYIIMSLTNSKDNRDRDLEFTLSGGLNKKELLDQLENTVKNAQEIIKNTSEQEFERVRTVQGFKMSGVGSSLHAVEHFSYHIGQIAFWVKQETKESLGFYDGFDLTIKSNEDVD